MCIKRFKMKNKVKKLDKIQIRFTGPLMRSIAINVPPSSHCVTTRTQPAYNSIQRIMNCNLRSGYQKCFVDHRRKCSFHHHHIIKTVFTLSLVTIVFSNVPPMSEAFCRLQNKILVPHYYIIYSILFFM